MCIFSFISKGKLSLGATKQTRSNIEAKELSFITWLRFMHRADDGKMHKWTGVQHKVYLCSTLYSQYPCTVSQLNVQWHSLNENNFYDCKWNEPFSQVRIIFLKCQLIFLICSRWLYEIEVSQQLYMIFFGLTSWMKSCKGFEYCIISFKRRLSEM